MRFVVGRTRPAARRNANKTLPRFSSISVLLFASTSIGSRAMSRLACAEECGSYFFVMKKTQIKLALFCAGLFAIASIGRGEGVPNVDVTVSDATGRLTYRGKTDANGVFATRPVVAGAYVVQFNAKNARVDQNDYAIYAAAGHRRVVADAISGAKLSGAGVAMRLKPAARTPIIGQVALGGVDALGTKIVNGVRYVLLPPATGDLGPRWVDEGTQAARNVTRIRMDDPDMIKPAPLGMAH